MANKHVLIADEPGLGKTIQSLAGVIGSKTEGSILIVAPKTAAYVTWPAELRRWLAEVGPDDPVRIIGGNFDRMGRLRVLRDIINWETGKAQRNSPRQWVIVSPNYLRFKYQVDGRGNFDYDNSGNKIVVPIREALKPLLYISWAAVIVDEAHQTLAGATGNIKKQSAQSVGLRLLQVRDGGLKIALSGTPFRGKHENIWGILNWLDPVAYNPLRGRNSYWRWIKRHFEVFHDDTFGIDVIGGLRSERNLAQETRKYMIRRTKKKVLPELPDKAYPGTPLSPNKKPPEDLVDAVTDAAKMIKREPQNKRHRRDYIVATKNVEDWYQENNPVAVWLPMEGKQQTAYKQMKREAMANLENGTLLANSILAEMTRLKQFANSYGRLDAKGDFIPSLPSNKFEWILQFLAERGIDGKPEPSGNRVVIASQFTRHINLFAHELREKHKIQCYTLTGLTSAEERVRYQEEFQSGVTKTGKPAPEVFLLNTMAGGVAIDLDKADDMVVIDRTHNPDDQVQLEDRIHRISNIHAVNIWNLATRGTIDEQILRKTRKMGLSLRRILDTPDKALAFLES